MKRALTITLIFASLGAEARLDEGSGNKPSKWEVFSFRAEQKVNELIWFMSRKLDQLTGDAPKTAKPDTQRVPASEPVPAPEPQIVVDVPAIPKAEAERAEFTDILENTRRNVQGKDVIQTVSPGRPAAADLPKTKAGVPTFSLKKVKKIPLLDVGMERTISRNEFLPADGSVGLKTFDKVKALDTPKTVPLKEINRFTKKQPVVVTKAKKPTVKGLELGSMVTQKKIDAVTMNIAQENPMTALLQYNAMTDDELVMLGAVLLFERGDKCHLVSGLLHQLSKDSKHNEEANFYLGVCAHKMGFHSEAVSRLIKVVESDQKEYVRDAIINLVEDLPREYDQSVARAIKSLKNSNYIDDKAKDGVNYVLARAAHAKNKFEEAANYASLVRETSKLYPNAQYIHAIGLYGQKKYKQAEQSLLQLRDWLTAKGKTDKNLEALIAANVARMRFMQKRYQTAYEEYQKVPKDHPLWVQALIEQGWTQLHIDDAAGAIGNMYSLHSPYFKSVFMPESWVVRTLGYIDICQYGDAYRSLTRLEQSHSAWLKKLQAYSDKNKKPLDYYNTVKNYIKGRSDVEVDGLPPQVIREIARQRGFLNVQNALNNREDEISQYGFIYGFIKKDIAEINWRVRKARERVAELKANIAKTKTQPELVKHLNEWRALVRNEEALIDSYRFQLRLFERSRKGYLGMKERALARIAREKSGLRLDAGRQLRGHLNDIRAKIRQIIEGNEFIRYEIFAGSGENIRYQVAGGATKETRRIPAGVKPQKILNWEFDGEYWEDEIGSYRSTLQNNCPKNARAAAN